MGFSKQEYWRGLPFPSPGDLPDPGIEPGSLALQANSLPFEPAGTLTSATLSLDNCNSFIIRHEIFRLRPTTGGLSCLGFLNQKDQPSSCPGRQVGGTDRPGTRCMVWWNSRTQSFRGLELVVGRGGPWRRKWQPTPVFLPGINHGQRSLASSLKGSFIGVGPNSKSNGLEVREPHVLSY